MTSISSLSSTSSTSYISQFNETSGKHHHDRKVKDGNSQGKDGGGMLGAIDSALKAAGISGGLSSIFGDSTSTTSTTGTDNSTDSTTSTSSADAASALSSFMQNLMAALQSQGISGDSDSDSEGDRPPPPMDGVSSADGNMRLQPPPGGKHGFGSDMESKLQSLISQLTSSDSSSTSATSSSDSTSATSSTSSTSELKSSFDKLMTLLGKSSSSDSDMKAFLQNLASNMMGHGTSGNVVSTSA